MSASGVRALRLVRELAVFVPAALVVQLSFRGGGASTAATAVAAVEITVVVLGWLLLAGSQLPRRRHLLVALGATAALGGWAALAMFWSRDAGAAAAEISRIVLYGGLLALTGLAVVTREQVRALAWSLALGGAAVCTAALAVLFLPGWTGADVHPLERLEYPLGYWNGLGTLAALSLVLALCATADAGLPRGVQGAAAAAIPLSTAALYASGSRGAAAAAVVGIGVYLAIGRPPSVLPVLAAVVPPALAAVVLVQLTRTGPFLRGSDASTRTVRLLALAVVATAAWAAAARLVAPATRRSMVAAGLVACAGVTAVVITAALSRPLVVSNSSLAAPSRILHGGSGGRLQYWDVAVHTAARTRLVGTGAGTFELEWVQHRDTARLFTRYAHSLYLGAAAELGLVGLALVVLLIATIGRSLAGRLSEDRATRALWAALLGVFVAWCVHAAIDWDWQEPAVTVLALAGGGAALAGGPGSESRGSRVAAAGVVALLLVGGLYAARIALAESALDDAVDAAGSGRCARAEQRAHDSLRWRASSGPYAVLALCHRTRQGALAVADIRHANELSPNDWRLRYDAALLLAAAGRDGAAAEARRAAELNPLDAGVAAAARALATGGPDARAFGRQAVFLLR